MSQLKKRKYVEIPMRFNGTLKFVKGVSKHTTCSDVINMVLNKTELSKENEAPELYGIFESFRGIERQLSGKSRVVKVVRSWGTDKGYELVFRKVNAAFVAPVISEAKRRKLTKQHQPSSDVTCTNTNQSQSNQLRKDATQRSKNCVNEVYINDWNITMDEYASDDILIMSKRVCSVRDKLCAKQSMDTSEHPDLLESVQCNKSNVTVQVNDVKYAIRKTLKTKPSKLSGCSRNTVSEGTQSHEIHVTPNVKVSRKASSAEVRRHATLACDIANKVARTNSREGKEALLQKYFADYITYLSPRYKYRNSRYRQLGDGAESDAEVDPNRIGDGSENQINSMCGRKPKLPLLFSDSEDSVDSGQEEDFAYFDNAFIATATGADMCSTPYVSHVRWRNLSSPKMSDTFIDIKLASVRRLVDYSYSEDSFLIDGSDISPISSVNVNVMNNSRSVSDEVVHSISSESDILNDIEVHNSSSVSDIIKAVFSDDREVSEDDEMESFMKTKLDDDLSDEGLSSLGSDNENEIFV